MIYIGYRDIEKLAVIERYCAEHGLAHVVVISPKQFPLPVANADLVDYEQVIMYVTFYRLLQEIGRDTLVVLNECLRTQNRYDLYYNCIRNFLNQTNHQLVFSQLPQIDEADDFMILFDFATRSRWKRHKFDRELVLDNAQVHLRPFQPVFRRIDVPTSEATRRKYAAERERLFATLGAKDPHTLPRNLYMIGGKDKAACLDSLQQPSLFAEQAAPRSYVARNKRLNRPDVVTYDQVQPDCCYGIVELPHRFLDFSDFLRTTWQAECEVLCADLKVDNWYFDRYTKWSERIHATYADLSQ